MKKIVSFILVIITLFSVSVTAFAASPAVKLGEKKKVTVKGDAEKTYSFCAPESGICKLNAKLLNNGFASIEVTQKNALIEIGFLLSITEDTKEIPEIITDMSTPNNKMSDKKCELYFVAQKNTVYTFTVANFCGWMFEEEADGGFDKNAKVEFSVTKFDAPTVKLGENTVSEKGELFLFIPDKSGKYNFRSSAEKGIDPDIEIKDAAGNGDFNDSNGYKDDINFDLTMNLKKGKSYLVVCSNRPGQKNKQTKPYRFTVSYNKAIAVEQIRLLEYGDEIEAGSVTLFEGEAETYGVEIVPTGAIPDAKITASVDNTEIATVKFDKEYNGLSITAVKAGKTTLTVTDANGASKEVRLVVLPKSLSFLRDIIEFIQIFILDFFMSVMSLFDKD